MIYEIVVTAKAERQLSEIALWWADNRSVEQAVQWHDGFVACMEGLSNALVGNLCVVKTATSRLNFGNCVLVYHRNQPIEPFLPSEATRW